MEKPEREIVERELRGDEWMVERFEEGGARYWRIVVPDSENQEAIAEARDKIREMEDYRQELRDRFVGSLRSDESEQIEE